MKPECPCRDRLFTEYRRAVKEWVAAINRLGENTGDPRLMEGIENSRFRALTAKARYNNHVTHHGCEGFTGASPSLPRRIALVS